MYERLAFIADEGVRVPIKVKLSEKSWHGVLAAIFLVYILLRFWNLTESCLWFDEIFSVHAAELRWENLFGFVAQDLPDLAITADKICAGT